jgi:DNA-binding transcriptional regulator YhcF (GntR family)
MKIRINKKGGIAIHEQIAEQIIFLTATDELKPGYALHGVRQLSRQLGIHRNTVSGVYADLVRRGWISGKRGGRLMVRPQDEFTRVTRAQDLDSMINAVIRVARQGGHSLQELRKRVRERLLEQAPDHLLVIEDDPGLLKLLQKEIKMAVRWPVHGCCGQDLRSNAGLAVGPCRYMRSISCPKLRHCFRRHGLPCA